MKQKLEEVVKAYCVEMKKDLISTLEVHPYSYEFFINRAQTKIEAIKEFWDFMTRKEEPTLAVINYIDNEYKQLREFISDRANEQKKVADYIKIYKNRMAIKDIIDNPIHASNQNMKYFEKKFKDYSEELDKQQLPSWFDTSKIDKYMKIWIEDQNKELRRKEKVLQVMINDSDKMELEPND